MTARQDAARVPAPDAIGAGTLKLIVVTAADASLAATAESELRARIPAADLRVLGPGSYVVYGEPSASDVRDWLARALPSASSVLVAEFERWSSFGDAIDVRWLLRRGH